MTTVTVKVGTSEQVVNLAGYGIDYINFPGEIAGPVFITAGSPILASRRTRYYSSGNEVNAVPASAASTSLVLKWYDLSTSGFTTDNIQLANPNSTSTTATV